MAFTDTQVRQLKAKLDRKAYKDAQRQRRRPHYVEGWHAIAEANRIFGFDAWDRRTSQPLRVERSKRAVSRRRLHRQSAGQRARRRYYDCAGGLRDGGRQGFYPGAST